MMIWLRSALAVSACAFCSTTLAASTTTLQVQLTGIRNAQGQVRISLYRPQDSFRNEAKAYRVATAEARTGESALEFADVPTGGYALMAYHDENANQRLDLRLGMFPLEGYGLSNNPHVIGPPSFADSAFELSEAGARIYILLSY